MKPETEWIVMTVLYAITMLVAFAGNGFLIYIVWKKPEVRSLTSFIFVNMAIADLLLTLVVMPWSISFIYTDGLWMIPGVFGKVMCKGVVYTVYVNLSASILCLTFMAIDRYYAIVHPLRRHLWFRKPKLTVPFIWIWPLVSMSIFPVIQTAEDYNNSSYCMLSVYILGDPDRALRGIYLFLFVVNYLIPLAIISCLYTISAWNLWFHVAPGVNILRGNRAQLETSKRRVIRMLIIVTCTFALCWLPRQVVHMMIVIRASKFQLQPIVSFVCFWFGHANSAVNPWLYIFLSTKINTAFTRIVSRKSSRLPSSLTVKRSDAVLPPEDEAIQKESRV
ncbi:unnamed protein product [Pocillopora meandrina]|uniref:G-protein coupled receptors family 1 profile domain-containing protein n=1 Tax=Pocillopora meandrina TaxID=46732 RepID=A0AAU9XK62_9CNID|nr:unnamed protein product [Pocillopora meandrina]